MPTTNVQSSDGEMSLNSSRSDERTSEAETNTSTQSEKPDISFFIPNLTTGGAEQITVNLVNGLSSRGYDVELLVSRSEGEMQSQLEAKVSVVELPPSRTPVLGIAAHLPALVSYLRRKQPAVLFPQMAHVSVVCLAASTISGTDTSIVPTHHTGFGEAPDKTIKSQIVSRLLPHLYPSADRIIAVSEGLADGIVEHTSVDRDDISVLYNPIHVDAIRKQSRKPVEHRWLDDDDKKVILFVGRIERQKDLETWLRAFKQIHRRDPNTRAVIAGQGSRRDTLLKFSKELGISEVVSMPGYVDNQYGYMRRASVFLLSSRYEGLPTVMIEALACGCPVVATNCPSGPSEILANGKYGPLVPVGDVTGLANAVLNTLGNPIPSEILQRRADDFAPDTILDRYEEFIDEYVSQ